MKSSERPEFLAYSLTDLMTSLMVIFILLFVVFLNNKAAVNMQLTNSLERDLKKKLAAPDFQTSNIFRDPKDKYTIVISVPNDSLTFEQNRYELSEKGQSFLRDRLPMVANILASPSYRDNIDLVVVEGHSDNLPYRGVSPEESQQLNLRLSQNRSMEVVKASLSYMTAKPQEREFLLEKLSATGRGEQDLASSSDSSRRVLFKIRVRSNRPEATTAAKP